MTVSETYTAIGDAIRRQYGATDKYKLGDIPKMIDYLEVRNLLDDGQYYDTTKGDSGDKILNGLDLATCQKYVGKTLLISFDVNWSGYKNDSLRNNRTGIEYGIKFKNSPEIWFSAWLYPDSPSGSKHIYTLYNFPNDEVTGIEEGKYYNQLNGEAVVKATNLKIVENPMGGVIKPNLLDLNKVELEGFTTQQSSLFVFNATFIYDYGYYEFLRFEHFQPKKNTKYRLSFTARGNGKVMTYVYGNKLNGTYVDNGTTWSLTDNWQDFTQDFSVESVPLNASFSFRATEIVSGEVTNLKFVEL